MDIVDRLFVAMFDSLNEKCKKELEAVGKQYPFEPLKVIRLNFGDQYATYDCLTSTDWLALLHIHMLTLGKWETLLLVAMTYIAMRKLLK